MAPPTEENYLKALFNLANSQGEITLSELASRLEVSLPTANSMVKSLQKSNWLNYEKYKPLTLTPEGRRLAASIIRKHRLTEMFLVDVMKFGWEEVHEVAEQIEHIHAPKFFDRMDEMLGHPAADPHGSATYVALLAESFVVVQHTVVVPGSLSCMPATCCPSSGKFMKFFETFAKN